MWKDMANEQIKAVLIKSQSGVFLFIFVQFICHNSQCLSKLHKLNDDSFGMVYKMIAEQPSLTQHERPMCHVKDNIIMLSSTEPNYMIYLFDFERFRIESRSRIFTHLLTLYIIL